MFRYITISNIVIMQVFIVKTHNVHDVLECRTFYMLMYTPVDSVPTACCKLHKGIFAVHWHTNAIQYAYKIVKLKLVIPTVSVSSHDQTRSLFRIQFQYGLVKVLYYELVQNCANELQIKVLKRNIHVERPPLCEHNVQFCDMKLCFIQVTNMIMRTKLPGN